MNGYEVASQLRQEECCKDAVIIAVSGYGQEEDRRRSQEAGFDHHLVKPLDHDALLSLLSAGASGKSSEGGSAPEKSTRPNVPDFCQGIGDT